MWEEKIFEAMRCVIGVGGLEKYEVEVNWEAKSTTDIITCEEPFRLTYVDVRYADLDVGVKIE